MTPTTRIRILWTFLAILVILGGLAAASPYLINTRLVKDQIADQISSWMGLPVRVSGEPVVTVFPYLTIKLREVEVSSNLGKDQPPLVSMTRLRAEMYWLPLILGEFKVRRFNLINPNFHIEKRQDGSQSWNLEKGSLFVSKDSAEGLNLADISLGRFNVSGGKVRYIDEASGRDEQLSNVDLSVAWPSTGRAASIEGSFNWRNEEINLEAASDRPMELITGGLSPLSLKIVSDQFNAALEGTAATLADLQLEGDFSFESPSLSRMLQWLGFEMDANGLPGAATMSGRANIVGLSASLSDLLLTLDNNRADGVLQIDLRRERSLVQGTLAYDDLDISSYLARKGEGPTLLEQILSPRQLRELDIDVRLSANRLLLGSISLGRTAASIMTRNQQLSLSIGEIFAYGGRLEANLQMRPVSEASDTMSGHLRAKANGVSAGTFAKEIGADVFVTGTALAELDLQGEGADLRSILRAATGDLSLVLTEGELSHFNLAAMQDALQVNGDVDPDALYEGGTRFDVLSVRGQLSDQIVQLDGLRMTAGKLALAGSASLSLESMEMDFPGILARYRTADPTSHSSEAPEKEFPFRLMGALDQPSLVQNMPVEVAPAPSKDISVPGVPDGAKQPEASQEQDSTADKEPAEASDESNSLDANNNDRAVDQTGITDNDPTAKTDQPTDGENAAEPSPGAEVDTENPSLQPGSKTFGEAADEVFSGSSGSLESPAVQLGQ